MKKLKSPNISSVRNAIKRVKNSKKYLNNNEVLNLIIKRYPNNTTLPEIYLKVVVLNDLYSTNIYDSFKIAEGISKLNIDEAIQNKELNIVHKIAKKHNIKTKNGDKWNFYSFATKYCSWHQKSLYPIFDSYVEKALIAYKRSHNFADFKNNDLKVYRNFSIIIDTFIKYFGLEEFELRDIDYFLWYKGKQLKPKKVLKFRH